MMLIPCLFLHSCSFRAIRWLPMFGIPRCSFTIYVRYIVHFILLLLLFLLFYVFPTLFPSDLRSFTHSSTTIPVVPFVVTLTVPTICCSFIHLPLRVVYRLRCSMTFYIALRYIRSFVDDAILPFWWYRYNYILHHFLFDSLLLMMFDTFVVPYIPNVFYWWYIPPFHLQALIHLYIVTFLLRCSVRSILRYSFIRWYRFVIPIHSFYPFVVTFIPTMMPTFDLLIPIVIHFVDTFPVHSHSAFCSLFGDVFWPFHDTIWHSHSISVFWYFTSMMLFSCNSLRTPHSIHSCRWPWKYHSFWYAFLRFRFIPTTVIHSTLWRDIWLFRYLLLLTFPGIPHSFLYSMRPVPIDHWPTEIPTGVVIQYSMTMIRWPRWFYLLTLFGVVPDFCSHSHFDLPPHFIRCSLPTDDAILLSLRWWVVMMHFVLPFRCGTVPFYDSTFVCICSISIPFRYCSLRYTRYTVFLFIPHTVFPWLHCSVLFIDGHFRCSFLVFLHFICDDYHHSILMLLHSVSYRLLSISDTCSGIYVLPLPMEIPFYICCCLSVIPNSTTYHHVVLPFYRLFVRAFIPFRCSRPVVDRLFCSNFIPLLFLPFGIPFVIWYAILHLLHCSWRCIPFLRCSFHFQFYSFSDRWVHSILLFYSCSVHCYSCSDIQATILIPDSDVVPHSEHTFILYLITVDPTFWLGTDG